MRMPAKLLFVALILILSGQIAFARVIKVGVVTDGQTENTAALLNAVDGEIKKLVPESDEVQFEPELIKHGTWKIGNIQNALDSLLKNTDVDAILAVGPLASQLASTRGSYARPVIAAHVINASMQGLK
ncbi:MAG: hypothetical protein PHD82_04485, partial [Candidatus Riflebacteria bacterium]|nr:hypothetical protein [Candidatus Riflebacteria bacterium]